MTQPSILDYLKDHRLYLDGGTGSLLMDLGLAPGELPETWNILHPDRIRQCETAYLLAGSNVIYTNTFGANSLKFPEDGPFPLSRLVKEGIAIAREAVKEAEQKGAPGPHYIALDIGPTGKLLKPLGDLPFEEAVRLFSQVVTAAEGEGADCIVIETMNDSYEAKAALLAAKENSSLPVFITTVYDEGGKLLTGADPLAMIALAEGLGADAVGMNCSLGPEEMKKILPAFSAASIPVIVKPNAGLPVNRNGKTCYEVGPEEFARIMKDMAPCCQILGGCCGTTPEHIRQMIALCEEVPYQPAAKKNISLISSYTHSVTIGEIPVMIGERINPTGKKKFQQALRNHDLPYILNEGLRQQEAGAVVLDVNVGLPEIDEPAMMEETVQGLQEIIDLPLQLDTTHIEALSRGLRCYNGKPLINSVNGKQEIMDKVFPLAAKYGGVLVSLLLDEAGIPETVEGRLAVADKILSEAAKYGIEAKDLIFDPLAMSVSSDHTAGAITLETVRRLSERGLHTILGVSNISFGLPKREWVTSSFFLMAMQSGLSAAIINPHLHEIWRSYYTYLSLAGKDPHCLAYLDWVQGLPDEMVNGTAPAAPVQAKDAPKEKPGSSPFVTEGTLEYAVARGLKELARQKTAELLTTKDPLTIINDYLVPGLSYVGQGFEAKKLFLPQLLMSADAVKEAFVLLKDHMARSGTAQEKKLTIVLATVKGDIHDIGKNIVKVLLENYGHEVIDLGKDVAPERVVEAAIAHHAPLVGLSALMTTTVPAMEETIRLLRIEAPWVKVCVGGAVMTPEYSQMIGADFYGRDAMETVAFAESMYKELQQKD